MGKRTIISLDKKIGTLKQKIRRLNYEKRQHRKIHLIELGTLFKILGLLNESQEVILGFLEKYKDLSYLEKQEYYLIGEKILSERSKESYDEDTESRRRMFFLMIRKAALLEKLKIHLEDSKILLGYLNTFSKISSQEKRSLEERGRKLFKPALIDPIISDKEKLELLKKSMIYNIDLTKILREEFNTTIHTIKRSQLILIEDKLKGKV